MSVDEGFFDRVAHDLRGELSTMLAGVHYLLRFGRNMEQPTRDMLERVSGAGDRLARLLEELDDAVWLLDTKKPLTPEKIRLADLVDDVLARAGKAAVARQVNLVVEAPEDGGDLMGDPDMLARALGYVVDLATLRSSGQTVTILVDVKDGAPFVRVSDEGGAVPEPILARLFEPFVEREILTRDAPAPRRKQRLGIGLPIARAIFEAHGGSLLAEASPSSQGLVFSCVLTSPSTPSSAAPPAPPLAASG